MSFDCIKIRKTENERASHVLDQSWTEKQYLHLKLVRLSHREFTVFFAKLITAERCESQRKRWLLMKKKQISSDRDFYGTRSSKYSTSHHRYRGGNQRIIPDSQSLQNKKKPLGQQQGAPQKKYIDRVIKEFQPIWELWGWKSKTKSKGFAKFINQAREWGK